MLFWSFGRNFHLVVRILLVTRKFRWITLDWIGLCSLPAGSGLDYRWIIPTASRTAGTFDLAENRTKWPTSRCPSPGSPDPVSLFTEVCKRQRALFVHVRFPRPWEQGGQGANSRQTSDTVRTRDDPPPSSPRLSDHPTRRVSRRESCLPRGCTVEPGHH